MKDNRRDRILFALKKLLAGIVRLSLRNGVTFKEMAHICKGLYVDICTKEYGIQGRPTNVSRVALMTGMDRKDIRKVLDAQLLEEKSSISAPDRVAKILTAWYQDDAYTDKHQHPLPLPISGKAPSFEQLVKSFGGDMPAVTILKELKRSETVVENNEGLVEIQKPYFVPNHYANRNTPELSDAQALEHGSSMLVDHINTIFHNLYRQDQAQREHIELRATNANIPQTKLNEYYELIDKKSMELLYEIDQWLESNASTDNNKAKQRLGLGVYFISGENQNLETNSPRKPLR